MTKTRKKPNPLTGHALHLFRDDATPDHRGNTRCGDCGLAREHRVHDLPERTADERAVEARRVGEMP